MSKQQRKIQKQDGLWAQLHALRGVTLQMGTIHEAQKFQLQVWGELAFPHVEQCEVAVGLPHLDEKLGKVQLVDQHVVEFRLKDTKGKGPPRGFRKTLEVLAKSVKDLLGEVFDVRVKVNKTVIYSVKGKPRKPTDVQALMKRLTDAHAAERGIPTV